MTPILAATDLSDHSERAVLRAAAIARAEGRPLRVVSIAGGDADASSALTHMDRAQDALDAMLERPELAGLDASAVADAGEPAAMVARAARDARAALVVLGSHANRGLGELGRAPTAVRIVRALSCPALVAVAPADRVWRRAVIGWDGSSASSAALALAARLAPEAALTVCQAHHEPLGGPEAEGRTAEWARRARAALDEAMPEALAPRLAEPELLLGGPVRVLLDLAGEGGADLLAVGRHARSGLMRTILGETSTELMLQAPCDVLVAPPR